jgi:hypothetical protein
MELGHGSCGLEQAEAEKEEREKNILFLFISTSFSNLVSKAFESF